MIQGYIGIDCGSTACKGIVWKDGQIVDKRMVPTGWSPKQSALMVVEQLLGEQRLKQQEVSIACTGYGREALDFAAASITEITCHAMGAWKLLPGVGTVIDIGGQDCKAISINEGKVIDFQMNDKCAAGTGRFLERTAFQLGVEISDFQELLADGQCCRIGSMCTVFAESEIVSLLACGESREAIAGGVVEAMASRAAALAARVRLRSPVLLSGGLTSLSGLRKALAQKLGCQVQTCPMAQYAGAIGAAVLVEKKENAR